MTPRQTVGLIMALVALAGLIWLAGWKVTILVYFLIFANNLLMHKPRTQSPGDGVTSRNTSKRP